MDHKYLDAGTTETGARIMITCTLPLSEIVTDFFDQLKSRTSGFASFEYFIFLIEKALFDCHAATKMRVTNRAISQR